MPATATREARSVGCTQGIESKIDHQLLGVSFQNLFYTKSFELSQYCWFSDTLQGRMENFVIY